MPRLRDFPDRRLACFGKPGRWKHLAPIMRRPINESVVLDHWGSDVTRLAASIKTGSAEPSHMLRKLGACRQRNRLHPALGEIGRIERSLFMPDWIENPRLRMECEAGLSRSETRHSLAKAVFAHSQGRVHDRSPEAQQKRVMALNLVIAAINCWNTPCMDKAASHMKRQGLLPDLGLLRHLAPLGWLHVNLTGDRNRDVSATMPTGFRPLNLTPMELAQGTFWGAPPVKCLFPVRLPKIQKRKGLLLLSCGDCGREARECGQRGGRHRVTVPSVPGPERTDHLVCLRASIRSVFARPFLRTTSWLVGSRITTSISGACSPSHRASQKPSLCRYRHSEGCRFRPRLADIGGARLWRADKAAQYGPLGEIAEGTVNIKLVVDNREDLIRFAGSLRLGHLKAAGVMRILQTRDRPTTLARALMHLGRLVKTLHVLDCIDDADFRRRILVQLNGQELRHKLARRICHGNRGESPDALRQGQEERLGALGLALDSVTHWNAVCMQEALARLGEQGLDVDPKDVARLSPVLWQHANFLGRYEIILPESVALGRLRPLRNPASAWES